MKAKVIIENGETTIVLKPENEFELNIVETIYDNKSKFNIHTDCNSDYNYGERNNYKLELNIKEMKI